MKKKILIVADWFEPGYKAGGPIASLKNIINAVKDAAAVYLLTRNYDIGETEPYNLQTGKWLNRDGYSIMYQPEAAFGNGRLINEIIENINPDHIYLNSFFSPKASILYIIKRKYRSRIVLAPRGEFGSGSISVKRLKKKLYLTLANALGLYRNIKFHASTEKEAAQIREHLKAGPIHIAPDLVETRYIALKTDFVKQEKELKLCFIARIVEYKNLKFCIEAIHNMGEDGHTITLDFYGPIESEPYWNQCKDLLAAYKLESRIMYRGILKPEEVAPAFRKYDFFFFPTWGENFGHVIFESLSVGTPVILANTTFWSGLPAKKIWSFFFKLHDINEACKILKSCLDMDNATYNEISKNAFNIAYDFAYSPDLANKTRSLFNLPNMPGPEVR